MQVLIADDDAVTRRIVGMLLTKGGHQVLEAKDGLTAWQLFEAHNPDVIIADWEMPGMKGLELVHRVRTHDGDDDYTYFILLTSHDDRAAITASSAAGVDDHLTKPLDPLQLGRRLAVATRLLSLQKRLAAVNHRMRDDLMAAQRAQMVLIPPPLAGLPGLTCAWRLQACDELAGDLVGALRLDDHRVAFYVVDVSGHGVAAALLAVQVARYLAPSPTATHALTSMEPLQVARTLNDLFQHQGPLQFLTLAYGILDLRDGALRMAMSAHPSPILLRKDGRIEGTEVASQPLGMFPSTKLHVSTWETVLDPGDRLLLFSDGMTEAMGPAGEYGRDRLAAALANQSTGTCETQLESLLSTLRVWTGGPFQDDVSLLLLQRS